MSRIIYLPAGQTPSSYIPRTVWNVKFYLKIPSKFLKVEYEVDPGHPYTQVMKGDTIEYDWGFSKRFQSNGRRNKTRTIARLRS